MKILTIILKILLGLVLLLPALGSLNLFGQPTADMYSPSGWAFMQATMNTGYLGPLVGLTCFIGLVLLIMQRTALASIIIAPLTVNVFCFHVFVDHSFFKPAAALAWFLIVLNLYFLWQNRGVYKTLWSTRS